MHGYNTKLYNNLPKSLYMFKSSVLVKFRRLSRHSVLLCLTAVWRAESPRPPGTPGLAPAFRSSDTEAWSLLFTAMCKGV